MIGRLSWRGRDAVELYISISALAYHFLSNRYTLAYLLDRKLSTEEDMNARDHAYRGTHP